MKKNHPLLLLLLLFAGLRPAPGQAAPGEGSLQAVEQTLRDIPDELLTIGSAPFRQPSTALKYAALLGGLILIDKPVTKFYQDDLEDPLDITLPDPPYELFGKQKSDGWLVLGLGGAYAGSFLAGDARGQTAALRAVKASAYSVLFAHLIGKTITGRNRPYRYLSAYDPAAARAGFGDDPWDFGNWHRPELGSTALGTGFPSFHFTLYFSVARVYQRTYHNTWIPYATMSVLLMNDIRGHNHWVSDMVAGALLGTWIGTVLTRDIDGPGGRFTIRPLLGAGQTGFALTRRF